MFHRPRAFLRVFPVKNSLSYPISNLYAVVNMKKRKRPEEHLNPSPYCSIG